MNAADAVWEVESMFGVAFRLRNALARYGRHDRECPAHGSSNIDDRCTCGLSKISQDLDVPVRVRSKE